VLWSFLVGGLVFAAVLAMTSTVALMMLMLYEEVVAVKFTFPVFPLSTFHLLPR
jgi:hypothetical protein